MSLTPTCFIHRHQNSQLAERVREREREVLGGREGQCAPARINNAGVWQCRRCTNIMAPNTASALSLSMDFFFFFYQN